MREIKFRAWNKKNRVMNFALPLKVWMDNIATDIGREKYLKDRDNIILMQYTGLKDKNGIEIYEGDILSVDEKEFTDKTNYEVKYFLDENYPAFDLEGWTGDANAFSEICGEQEWEMEVIGNIYENSHLLDNKEGQKAIVSK